MGFTTGAMSEGLIVDRITAQDTKEVTQATTSLRKAEPVVVFFQNPDSCEFAVSHFNAQSTCAADCVHLLCEVSGSKTTIEE